MKKWFFYLAAAACLASCIYRFDPELDNNPEKTVVVDGRILIGGTSTIRLDYLTPLNSPRGGMPNGLAWIEDDLGNRYTAIENAGSQFNIPTGNSPESSSVYQAQRFRAVAVVDGETYVSDWLTPDSEPQILDIRFSADESTVVVSVDIDPGFSRSGYLGFLFEETWEFHSDVYPEYEVNPNTWSYSMLQNGYPYYWCWRSFNPVQVTLMDYTNLSEGVIRDLPVKYFLRSDTRNHRRYSILVKAFALSKEAFDYNKRTQEISDIGGDLFTPDPGAITGNLVCETHPDLQVMGMVLAGKVTSKRAWLNSRFLISRPAYVDYVHLTRDEMPQYYYNNNYRPVNYVTIDGTTDMGWTHHRCINCIEAGGTQEKPSFWEEE